MQLMHIHMPVILSSFQRSIPLSPTDISPDESSFAHATAVPSEVKIRSCHGASKQPGEQIAAGSLSGHRCTSTHRPSSNTGQSARFGPSNVIALQLQVAVASTVVNLSFTGGAESPCCLNRNCSLFYGILLGVADVCRSGCCTVLRPQNILLFVET